MTTAHRSPADGDANGVCFNELRITAPDGVSLLVRRWSCAAREATAEVLVLHGYMEHSGRYRELAHAFAAFGISTTAVDLRGHGRADGPRGYVRRFTDYHEDAAAALHLLGDAPIFLLGHSNGGLIALDFVTQRKPQIAGLVVTNPFLGMAEQPPWLKLKLGQLAGRVRPHLSIPSGLDPAGISHDLEIVGAYERDPMVFSDANASWFREVTTAQERVLRLHEISVPLLYVYSDSDPVASPTLNRGLADKLQAADKTVIERQGEYHEVLNEIGRETLHQRVAQWIIERVPR